MISKITRGADAGGLVRYLGGKSRDDGRHINFHTDQRVIGGSLGLEGRLDAELTRQVIRDLDAPGLAYPDVRVLAKVKGQDGAPDGVKDAPIWHCSLSIGADEGVLSDAKWQQISGEFMERMRFDDPSLAPSRWVAIRHGTSEHGNDHVHLAASLIREDGRTVDVYRDYVRAGEACNAIEHAHGLQVIAARETGTGGRSVSAAELRRSRDDGGALPDRVYLEQTVRAAAGASTSEAEFVRRLRGDGLQVRAVRIVDAKRLDLSTGPATGYSVAREGSDVWFRGGTLSRDLTLPRLRAGWRGDPAAAIPAWQGEQTPGRETGLVPADPLMWRKATAELRSMERRVTAGKLTPAQLADTAGLVSGALSAAATRPEYSRGEIPKAARDAGRMAGSRAKGAPVARLPLAAALIFLQAQDRDSLAQTVMVRQLLSTYRAIQDRAKPRETGMSMGEPDGLDEVADVGATMAVTTAAVGWEKHARQPEPAAHAARDTERAPAAADAAAAVEPVPAKPTAEQTERVVALGKAAGLPMLDQAVQVMTADEADKLIRTLNPTDADLRDVWAGPDRGHGRHQGDAGNPQRWYVDPDAADKAERLLADMQARTEQKHGTPAAVTSDNARTDGTATTDPKTRAPGEWKTGDQPVTARQRAVLLNHGVDSGDLAGMTKAQASERISAKRAQGNVVTMPPPDPRSVRTETRGHGRRR